MNRIVFLIIIMIIALYSFENAENIKEQFITESILDITHSTSSLPYKKYFVMPLDSDDYDTPLLDGNITSDIEKNDDNCIVYGNSLFTYSS